MSAPICSIPDVQRKQPDPSMYLCVQSGYTTIWYVINSTTPPKEHLRPCLPSLPEGHLQFGCGVVGPVIYVAGGEYMDVSLHNEVHCIDTLDPGSGWKKGCPMEVPRCMPRLVTVDRKLYAFGGIFPGESSYAEVFDESKSRWNALESLSSSEAAIRSFPAIVSGAHVVSDNNNMMKSMILLHDKVFPSVTRYNIKLDSWDTFSESSLGIGKETSALVDGILYCLDRMMPGYMFGLDISDPENKLQQVLGFESVKWMPLPQPDYDGSSGPPGFLVSLGESKLAVLWGARTRGPNKDTFMVSYSVLNMSKRLNPSTDRVDFVAHTLSGSYYYMSGHSLRSCLPVFPSEKQSETEGISKDGSMASGSRSNKSNFYDPWSVASGSRSSKSNLYDPWSVASGSRSNKSNFYEKKKGRNKNAEKPLPKTFLVLILGSVFSLFCWASDYVNASLMLMFLVFKESVFKRAK